MPKKIIDPLHNPATWYATAAALMAAARTLWPKVRAGFPREGALLYRKQFREFRQHAPAFLLLSAFAVENALKGTKVKHIRRRRRTPSFSSRKTDMRSPDNVWGHDLPQLAQDIGLVTDQLDEEMLHVLKRNIEWAGRYPGTPGHAGWFVPRYGSDDLQRIVRLIRRIKQA